MAKYTTLVKSICESLAGQRDPSTFANADTVINQAIPKIFSHFPLYNEEHRNILCSKILKHYYFREICCETVGQWKFYLNSKLNEIMPFYNEMYKTVEFEYNPLHNVDITRTGNENLIGLTKDNETKAIADTLTKKGEQHGQEIFNGTNDITRNATNSNTERFSDTPQNELSDIQQDKYLTSATLNDGTNKGTEKSENSSTNTVNNTNSSTDTRNVSDSTYRTNDLTNDKTYTEKITGKNNSESYSKIIMEYRKAILNVDMMIINELEELFFKLW